MSNVGDSEIGWRDDDVLASLTIFGKAKLTGSAKWAEPVLCCSPDKLS